VRCNGAADTAVARIRAPGFEQRDGDGQMSGDHVDDLSGLGIKRSSTRRVEVEHADQTILQQHRGRDNALRVVESAQGKLEQIAVADRRREGSAAGHVRDAHGLAALAGDADQSFTDRDFGADPAAVVSVGGDDEQSL
jgi:hypothetical protein